MVLPKADVWEMTTAMSLEIKWGFSWDNLSEHYLAENWARKLEQQLAQWSEKKSG